MAVRTLADGNIKFTVLTTKPADPKNPTVTELEAGIDASCLVVQDGHSWTAAASDTIDEAPLCSTTNGQTPGRGNSNLSVTAWRWYDPETGAIDAAADELYAALRTKGTTVWGYTRVGAKPFGDAWEAADEIDYGAEVITDTPQLVGTTGLIKYAIPMLAQNAWSDGVVSAGA